MERNDKEVPRQNLLYKNIYHALCSRIFSGEFPPGKRLPAMDELAQTYGVPVLTIRATYRLLQEIGLIRVSRGKDAVVVYGTDDPESKRRFLEWLAGRARTLSEVGLLAARLAADTAAFGASQCGENELARLAEIAAAAQDPALPVNRLAFALAEFYFVLIRPLHNDLLEDLMRACDRTLAAGVLLAAQDERLCAQYTGCLRAFLRQAQACVAAHSGQALTGALRTFADELRGLMMTRVLRITEGCPMPDALHFSWAISGDEGLYSEIASDLILRISSGEFLDGAYLPCEQKLQREYAASSKTIRSALIALNECGVVRTVNGVGTAVTYLSPAGSAGSAALDPQEAHIFFHALQLLMLGAAALVRDAFVRLTDPQIAATRARIERLLAAPDRRFYSYAGILLHIVIEGCPQELTRRVYGQLNTRLLLFCRRRREYEAAFGGHFEQSMPFIAGALVALDARDAGAYLESLQAILRLTAQSTRQICAAARLRCEVPLPLEPADGAP